MTRTKREVIQDIQDNMAPRPTRATEDQLDEHIDIAKRAPKRTRWLTVGGQRIEKLMDQMDLFAHCANPDYYAYTNDEIDMIERDVNAKWLKTIDMFRQRRRKGRARTTYGYFNDKTIKTLLATASLLEMTM
jgi:hypothetical protein